MLRAKTAKNVCIRVKEPENMKEKYIVTGVVLELGMSYYNTTQCSASTILVTQAFLMFTLYEVTKDKIKI